MSRIRAALRQRRHHRAFRIAAPVWDDARLDHLLTSLAGTDEPPNVVDEAALADAATNLWRARKKLGRCDGPASTQARQAGRYLRSSHDALALAGLIVQDHDGAEFDSGLSLEVLVFQDDPALTTEVVLETVRPSVYFRGRPILMGQVIVGCPAQHKQTVEDHHA
ncbi:MAG TPA: hypothetical protein VIY28_19835 [Pseudonocardiaceae bacterium]